jgi:C-terminal processing protease CtpA/Prc
MNKQFIFVTALFALGVAAGAAYIYSRDDDSAMQQSTESEMLPALPVPTAQNPMADAFALATDSDAERILLLEQQVRYLNERIEQLEQTMTAAAEQQPSGDYGALAGNITSAVDTPVSRQNPMLTMDNLIKAGIDSALAADIVRRKNEYDLKLLELRDRAAREGYLGSGQYQRELNALMTQHVELRDEIGDDAYDQYLYATGQHNRVKIASVMMGSPAEQAGLKTGDMILGYNDRPMFSWNELQGATTQGERGEYVNVSVIRNGQLMNLWVPRGPLGVRLGTVRVRP